VALNSISYDYQIYSNFAEYHFSGSEYSEEVAKAEAKIELALITISGD
jgi:hypothetical protein